MTVLSLEERLERGEILTFAPCLFPLPQGEDAAFLLQQKLRSTIHKNISYNPDTDQVFGFVQHSPAQAERLCLLMRQFSQHACGWLANLLPCYACDWHPDRASLRTEEEAIRKLRVTARNDLLHFDAFPSRPSRGHRILRLYVNINPTDDRIWMTSDTFAKILHNHGEQIGLAHPHSGNWLRRLGKGLLRVMHAPGTERTPYDEFMLRLHHYMKSNDEFQERSPRRLWHFKPGTAWLLFSDGLSHADLRGQFALEHSFFVPPQSLALPTESPSALLERCWAASRLPGAA